MTIEVPYDWLPKVPKSIIENQDIPLFGYSPSFPWEQFSESFSQIFQIELIKFNPSAWEIRMPEKLFEGLGSKAVPLYLELPPLSGKVCFAMAEEDIDRLMTFFLLGKTEVASLIDPDYRHGFYHFLALEVLNIISRIDYVKGIVPHILESGDLPTSSCSCQDILFELSGSSYVGRIIVSEEFRHSWKERFAERSLTQSVPSNLEVTVHLEAGNISLSKKEWDAINVGDCLLLEHCTLEESGEKGRVMLTLNGKPVYRAKVKDGNVKILESPFFSQINTSLPSK